MNNLDRWRADAALNALWRVSRDPPRQRWHNLPMKPLHLSGQSRSELPGVASSGAAFLLISVEALPELGIEEHALRLWRSDLSHLLDEVLTGRERHELKYHLAAPRYTAVFRYHSGDRSVRRNDTVKGALVSAALQIYGDCQEVHPHPASPIKGEEIRGECEEFDMDK